MGYRLDFPENQVIVKSWILSLPVPNVSGITHYLKPAIKKTHKKGQSYRANTSPSI